VTNAFPFSGGGGGGGGRGGGSTIGAADPPICFRLPFYWPLYASHGCSSISFVFGSSNTPAGDFLPPQIATFSWHRFAAIQIRILVCSRIYVHCVRSQSPVACDG